MLAQLWLARRFRRRVNPGVVAATALVLVTWVIGLHRDRDRRRRGEPDRGRFVRRRQRRGHRPDPGLQRQVQREPHLDRPWFRWRLREGLDGVGRAGDRQPGGLVAAAPASQWNAYAAVHRQIRALDDSGKWDQAVRLATGTGAGSANATFGGFDEQIVGLSRSGHPATTERASAVPGSA